MATLAHPPAKSARPRRRPARHNPLTGPVFLFAAATLIAAVYVAYVLWPRWPDTAVTLHAPALPIIVASVTFNVEPAAIRMAVQRHAGTAGAS